MKSILVLEDDDNFRELLVDILDSLSYRVEGASSPDQALQLARETPFDVVLSDVRMAGPVDGLGALELLKKQRPSLRCLVMTGYADELAPLRALQIRVDDYLYKPFETKDLVAALERVKKSVQQNQWYHRALGRLFGQPDPLERLAKLQEIRQGCLKQFFVAVRSNFLYAETALAAWDTLEDLEIGYFSAMRSPNAVTAASAESACARYTAWLQLLVQHAANQELVIPAERSAEKLDRVLFQRFLEGIKQGRVSAEELGMAVSLRRMPAERRAQDPEYQVLWQRMWG